MNSAHIYRPLVATAGATLEHVADAGTVKPEHYARDERYLPGCFMSAEFIGEQVKSNHPKVFRVLSEAECRRLDRRVHLDKKIPGRWDWLRDAATFRHELNFGSGR